MHIQRRATCGTSSRSRSAHRAQRLDWCNHRARCRRSTEAHHIPDAPHRAPMKHTRSRSVGPNAPNAGASSSARCSDMHRPNHSCTSAPSIASNRPFRNLRATSLARGRRCNPLLRTDSCPRPVEAQSGQCPQIRHPLGPSHRLSASPHRANVPQGKERRCIPQEPERELHTRATSLSSYLRVYIPQVRETRQDVLPERTTAYAADGHHCYPRAA